MNNIHACLEESLFTTCPNCSQRHNAKFFSLFLDQMHYIIGDCTSCGYRIEFRQDELGAGLFLPDGNVATIKEVFKKEHVEHMRERLKGSATPIVPTHANLRLRFIDSPEAN